jgi:hypothetical protein
MLLRVSKDFPYGLHHEVMSYIPLKRSWKLICG